jgi:hypothetical protein
MCLPVRRNHLTQNWRSFLGRIYQDEKNYEAGLREFQLAAKLAPEIEREAREEA